MSDGKKGGMSYDQLQDIFKGAGEIIETAKKISFRNLNVEDEDLSKEKDESVEFVCWCGSTEYAQITKWGSAIWPGGHSELVEYECKRCTQRFGDPEKYYNSIKEFINVLDVFSMIVKDIREGSTEGEDGD